jgi:phytoene synthase
VAASSLAPLKVGDAPGLSSSAARAVIRAHSRSFSLASLLLGSETQHDAIALYAWCRRADDAIDLAPTHQTLTALSGLWRELDDVYDGRALSEPTLAEFQRVAFERQIPRAYPQALLEGFMLDAASAEYETISDLYRYCWCVAGSVGAMMCHVLGVRRERAVMHGAHLGMAMQITNICRDVLEDFERGRLYVPRELLGALELAPGSARFPSAAAPAMARAVRILLRDAERFYVSGDRGLRYLSLRSRLAVTTARRVYSAIGAELEARGGDVLGGRAVVPGARKAVLLAQAVIETLTQAPLVPRFQRRPLRSVLRYPDDVLPC